MQGTFPALGPSHELPVALPSFFLKQQTRVSAKHGLVLQLLCSLPGDRLPDQRQIREQNRHPEPAVHIWSERVSFLLGVGWEDLVFESSTPQQRASRKGSSVTPPSPQAVELHFPSALANVAKAGGMGLAVQQYLQSYLILCCQAFPFTPRCVLVYRHSLPSELPLGLMPANALGSFR